MKIIVETILAIHIAAGSLSLILFWIPAFAKKQKGLHTLVGKWYVIMMWIVVVTAAMLSVNNLFIGRTHVALFLGFLSMLTMNPLWYAISVMKSKKAFTKTYIRMFIIFNSLIVVFGAFLTYYGLFVVETGSGVLMIVFGVLGILNIRQLREARVMKATKPDWLKIHYSGMIISGIAAYTAFFAFGGRQFFSNLLTNEWQIIPWIAPTLIGVTVIRILHYGRKIKQQPKDL